MRADFLPYLFVFVILLATAASYGVAVGFDHVPAFLPYISDTGVFVPERSVFSFLINIGAFIHMITIYVRFEQVQSQLKCATLGISTRHRRNLINVNKTGLLIGLSCSLGLCLIGNFQLHTERTLGGLDPEQKQPKLSDEEIIVQKVHWLGAFLTFIGGVLWMAGQTAISWAVAVNTEKGHWKRRIALTRMTISIFTLLLIILGICSALSSAMHNDQATGKLQWNDTAKTSDTQSTKGIFALVAVLCEWISTLLILLFALTLAPELRQFRISRPKVKPLKNDERPKTEEKAQDDEGQNDVSTDPLLIMQLA